MNILKELQLLPFVVGLAIGLAASPAFAQGYSYNYGSSRVTNQGSIGLNNHDSTYISPGTMSDSARGVNRGYALNPNLPSVSLGRNVKTAGDNFYYGNAPDKIKPSIQRKVMYRVNNQQNQQRQNRPQGNVYYPGQNANASIQRGAGGALQYNSSGGAITYADADSSSNSNQNQNNQNQNQSQNQNQNQKQNSGQ
ncbi:MAG: hypothetical protein KIT34_14375 [Cyanobacteria bacterium TGS_CYA1]|nr:hypothetical protein [Cyanobacteria bacterium TGS_CYA1]